MSKGRKPGQLNNTRKHSRIASDPEYHKWKMILNRYHLTEEQWNDMLRSQDYCCLMCGESLEGRIVCVDHDHKCCAKTSSRKTCGKCVRGLLCSTCNQALGFYEKHHEQCKEYLERVADG